MYKHKAFVALGRTGDIINALPLAYEEYSKTGKPVDWIVSEKFKSVLDGCSYVHPIAVPCSYDKLGSIFSGLGHQLCPHKELVRAQAWGTDIVVTPQNKHFCTDVWNWYGLPYGCRVPIFDRRSTEDEEKLIATYCQDKPMVLINTNGTSGAFRYGAKLLALVKTGLPEYNVVDLSTIQASHIYDLLGLFTFAKALITIDTATLHLAAAIPSLPVIALIPDRDQPWCVAPYRKGQVLRVFYSEYEKRIGEILDAVRTHDSARIHHVWCDWRQATKIGEASRIAFARNTWTAEGHNAQWIDAEFKEADAFRTSDKTIGDNRKMPYIRDMVDNAICAATPPNDIICLTNSDICFVPGLSGWILENCARHGSTWAQRWDSLRPFTKPLLGEYECGRLSWYDGADLFAFTVKWWRENRLEYPDMLLGCESWDAAMRQLIKKTGGVETHKAIYHQRHDSFWYRPGNREFNPGNIYNRALNKIWLARTGFPWMDMSHP